MRLKQALAPLVLLSGLCLTACASQPATIDYKTIYLKTPAALLTCAPEPAAPTGTITDAMLADWIAAGFDAGRDCRYKLGEVKALEGQ